MYGFVNYILQTLVKRKFGDATWMEIKTIAGISTDGDFAIYDIYDDHVTYDLVEAAEKILSTKVPATTLLEIFGEFFYEYCVEAGYAGILRSLGATPVEFLQNLDALHDHLGSAYVGMRAPSFRCTTDEDDEDGTQFYLHYYSHRPGLSPIVIGLVRAAIAGIFNIQVQITVMENPDNHEQGEVRFSVTITEKEQDMKKRLGSTTSLNKMPAKLPLKMISFEKLFPFHLVFNRQLKVIQVGQTIARIFSGILTSNIPVDQILEFIRPRMSFTFANILSHINTVYVLSETPNSCSARNAKLPFKLKGQMTFQWQYDVILFFASPAVSDLQNLYDQGLYFSDLAVHDATRSLLLMSEDYSKEYEMAANLEMMTNSLQIKYRELDEEKQKTDSLVYSVLPPSIADDLRHGRKIAGRRFENVTLLFSGIRDFAVFCTTHDPIDIINLLTDCYTAFDNVLDPVLYPDVYKVETIADHYMAVSGCPQETESHAKAIADLALALAASSKALKMDGKKLQITFGIHSGEIMAGVIGDRTPRYCLFGDCVNTTSRTEAFGKNGRINLTGIAYRLLQRPPNQSDNFSFAFHDNVTMKGKPQPVPVWLLSGSNDKVEETEEQPDVTSDVHESGPDGKITDQKLEQLQLIGSETPMDKPNCTTRCYKRIFPRKERASSKVCTLL